MRIFYTKGLASLENLFTFASELHNECKIVLTNKQYLIMGLFSFLNRKNESENAAISMLPVINPAEQAEEEVNCVMTAPESEPQENKPLTVSYATGWPIDIIYGYLHKNYEEKGFNDSMVKSDLTFRDMNMNIIKNKILMVFREINLSYDVMKRDVETRMDTCNAAGLISTVGELENQMAIVTTHKQELEQLEREFKADDQASVPLQSYNCGFLRGVATIAMTNPQRKTMPQANIAQPLSQQRATA
jgi:hypothetical protein